LSNSKLIDKLRDLGVKLTVDDAELKVSPPKGVFTAELRDELTRNKDSLVELLSAGDAGAARLLQLFRRLIATNPSHFRLPRSACGFS